jgi:2-keto-4-pentenoate hydratase/2-oxohepta-3-ene-1,7-dioic acid hydratase in catechol pathway
MKIAAFLLQGVPGVGLVSADGTSVQPYALSPHLASRGALPIVQALANGTPLPELLNAVALTDVRLTAPIPRPHRNIFCVGKNYFAHAKEFGAGDVPSAPIIFSKVPETVVGPNDFIEMPVGVSEAIDYEAELAVIIGKGGKGIRAADAMQHVWGYTIVNDVTARDWQNRHQQWHMGKSFDTFCPMGPWLVSAEECNGADTAVRCFVNGELRQDARTSDLIFNIPTLIETLSAGITLFPGDIIATGTPAGVGIGFKPPKYLTAGDVVRIEIEGIGQIENRVR